MDALQQSDVEEFLTHAGISAADPARNIGRELTFVPPARRTVVVNFGPDDPPEYIAQVVTIILSLQDRWLLIPRFGTASQLAVSSACAEAEALAFSAGEREQLCGYLCTRDMALGSVSSDLYVVAGDGRTIVTWDHHTHDEGLEVSLQEVGDSSSLLTALNRLGAELEVFYMPS